MIVGGLVESAARKLKETLLESGLLKDGYDSRSFADACCQYIAKFGPLKAFVKYHQPPDVRWNDETYQGDAYGAYGWAVYLAEVSVDTRTAEVRVDSFTAVQEVGTIVNPMLAAGQVEGGVAQGIGFAVYENVVWKEGRMINGQMTNYIMPTSMDVPPIRVIFEEVPYGPGPSGAKGIGELPLDGTAPAVANAVSHATGVDIRRIPVTPEALSDLLAARELAHA
jgi:CO/xanthine dehydrogenase Mo-binding subunit